MNRRTVNTTIKNIKFQNSHIVYENFIKCTIKDYEYNLTYNPTLLSGSQSTLTPYSSSLNGDIFYISTGSNENYGILKDFYTGSVFSPYTTTVGLYNDAQELLAIAKMSAPIPLAANTDMTFLIKYDTTWVDRPYIVPSPTPSPSPICIIEGTAILLAGVPVTPSVTPSISITPSITPSISVTPSITPSITTSPSVTPSISVSPSIQLTPSVTPSVTPSITITPSKTPSITPSLTPSITPSLTPSPSLIITYTQIFGWKYNPCSGDATIYEGNNGLYYIDTIGTLLNNTIYIYAGPDGDFNYFWSEIPFVNGVGGSSTIISSLCSPS